MKIALYIILLKTISLNFNLISSYTVPEENNSEKEDFEADYWMVENTDYELTSDMAIAAKCNCRNGYCEKDLRGTWTCKCHPEWGHTSKSNCMKCDCGKGANCTFTGFFSTKTCICKKGYMDIKGVCKGSCNPNPCRNGGICHLKESDIVCTCKDGFKGDHCEISSSSITSSTTVTALPYISTTTLYSSTQNERTILPVSTNTSLSTTMTIVTDTNSTMFTTTTHEDEIYRNSSTKVDDMTPLNNTSISLVTDTSTTKNYTTMFNSTTEEDYIYLNSSTNSYDMTTLNNASISLVTDTSTITNYTTMFITTTKEDKIYRNSSTKSDDSTTLKDISRELTAESEIIISEVSSTSMITENATSISLSTTIAVFNDSSSATDVTSMNITSPKENISYSSITSNNITVSTNTDIESTEIATVTASTLSDLCTENPCKNEGICQMKGGQMKCYCKSPFTGEFCENDSCKINFCRNGGTCSVRNTTFYCNCDAPFYGEFCEKDPCSKNPCQNGGSCFIRRNTFICDCKKPYVGSTCELDSTSCPKLIIIAILATSVVFLIAYSICLSVRQFKRY